MQDRIQVNGIWYVRETDTTPELEINETDITFSMSRVWESDDWCFEATIIMRDGAETLEDHYPDPIIDVTDKRAEDREDWTEDEVDNPRFMIGVLEGDPDSMKEAKQMFDAKGIEEFRAFVRHLIQIGWLIRN